MDLVELIPDEINDWKVEKIVPHGTLSFIIEVVHKETEYTALMKIKFDPSLLNAAIDFPEFYSVFKYSNLMPKHLNWYNLFGTLKLHEDIKHIFTDIEIKGTPSITWFIMDKCEPLGPADLENWQEILKDIVLLLRSMHINGILHNDVKYNHIMKLRGRYVLIDYELCHQETAALSYSEYAHIYNVGLGMCVPRKPRTARDELRALGISILFLLYPEDMNCILKMIKRGTDVDKLYESLNSTINDVLYRCRKPYLVQYFEIISCTFDIVKIYQLFERNLNIK